MLDPIPSPTAPRPLRILVAGAGAVGAFYGARLAQSGQQVSVLCRSNFDAVRRQGFTIDSIDGNFSFRPHAVFRTAAEAGAGLDGPMDYILVAVKALAEIDVVELIRPAVGPATVIFLLQNGIDIEAPVADAFPDNELLSGLAFVCVSQTAPGCIAHTCFGRLALGRHPSGHSAAAQRLAACFEAAGAKCAVSESVATDRWRKLVWNAPFNPISVLGGGLTTAQMLTCPETAALVAAVMREVCALAGAAGHPLPDGVVEKNLADTRAMKPYRTSMLLDFLAGRPMEVEAILGNPVRLARRLGVDAPRLQALYALLKQAELGQVEARRRRQQPG